MSATTAPFPNAAENWDLPSRGKVAMACLIIAESAIFTIFVDADLLHHLLVVEQPDHSPCGEVSSTRHHICIPWVVVAHDRAWGSVPLWHSDGMAQTNLRTRANDIDQPLRNNLLLARRPACVSRHCWSHHACDRRRIRSCWSRGNEAVLSHRSARDVLAFRGCRMDCGFHGSLRSWTLRNLWRHDPRQSN